MQTRSLTKLSGSPKDRMACARLIEELSNRTRSGVKPLSKSARACEYSPHSTTLWPFNSKASLTNECTVTSRMITKTINICFTRHPLGESFHRFQKKDRTRDDLLRCRSTPNLSSHPSAKLGLETK